MPSLVSMMACYDLWTTWMESWNVLRKIGGCELDWKSVATNISCTVAQSVHVYHGSKSLHLPYICCWILTAIIRRTGVVVYPWERVLDRKYRYLIWLKPNWPICPRLSKDLNRCFPCFCECMTMTYIWLGKFGSYARNWSVVNIMHCSYNDRS